jgi:hypothetical protein
MTTSKNGFDAAVSQLWKDPSEKNWVAFSKALKDSKIRYYKTFYVNDKIKRLKDLKESYAVLYDGKYKVVTKVPVYKKASKNSIEGAMIYLMGLLNANKVD